MSHDRGKYRFTRNSSTRQQQSLLKQGEEQRGVRDGTRIFPLENLPE